MTSHESNIVGPMVVHISQLLKKPAAMWDGEPAVRQDSSEPVSLISLTST